MTEIRKPMEGCFGSAEIFSERNLRGIGRAAEPFRRNGAGGRNPVKPVAQRRGRSS